MSRPSESFLSLVRTARAVHSPLTFEAFIAEKRRALSGAQHPHVGLLVGMRVQEFQNWLLDENVKWKLTDAQLLAVMRLEFPQARGQVFTGDVHAGLKLLAGIRAHYNRDGHNGKSPQSRGLPLSISYGTFEPHTGTTLQAHHHRPAQGRVVAARTQSEVVKSAGNAGLVTHRDLSEWRSQIVRLVRALESRQPATAVADGIGARIGQLSRAGLLPRDVAALMRTVTEMRNSAEYDGKSLSAAESAAVRHSSTAILEWAQAQGLV